MTDELCDLLCLDLPRAEEVRAGLPSPDELERSAGRAQALSDPTRLSVAVALAAGDELCGCDLAWIIGRAQNLVSHHLRALRQAGVVTSRRDGKMVMHSLSDEGRALLSSVRAGDVTA
jgi:ArsR family transcriptional regulator, lead/cadmium/zinc/bismuth-responsive transcriptional repressor